MEQLLQITEDISSIISSSNADLNRSICEEFDVSADEVTISYDSPEPNPFDGMDAFYMNIRINGGTASGNQDTPPAEPEPEEAGNTDDKNTPHRFIFSDPVQIPQLKRTIFAVLP